MQRYLPFFMLFFRIVMFAVVQLIIALILYIFKDQNPFYNSQSFWILFVSITNLLNLFILIKLYKLEGKNFFESIWFKRNGWWKDLLITLGLFLVLIPLAIFPNMVLSTILFGTKEYGNELLFRHIPMWAIIFGFIWPLTHPLVELPTYFSYCMPRIEKLLENSWMAWIIVSVALALQHITLPLIFDFKYVTWRFLMFLLFALIIGLFIKLRPRLLPYFALIHGLIDLQVVIIFLSLKQ